MRKVLSLSLALVMIIGCVFMFTACDDQPDVPETDEQKADAPKGETPKTDETEGATSLFDLVIGFLHCDPAVFVVGDEYEILVNTNGNGIISINVGGVEYYAANSGPLPSEKNYAKIRVPQSELDLHREYTVVFRKTINRSPYNPTFENAQTKQYTFKPITKTDNINIYQIADVHQNFIIAKKTAAYFGDDIDLFIVNGDIAEYNEFETYREVAEFVGDISGGNIPVVFARGNHDVRGKLAEMYTDYFPTEGYNAYYEFDIGPLHGIVLDCGEDKPDSHEEYGGANAFEAYRRRETAFLEALEPSDKLTFAVSHICPAQPADSGDGQGNTHGDEYDKWMEELDRLDVSFMLSAHVHRTYILEKNDSSTRRPHSFPVIVGSATFDNDLWGTAITVSGEKLLVKFTDMDGMVCEHYTVDLASGKVE